MKHSFFKTLLVAGLALSPAFLMAQTPESKEAGATQPPKKGNNADRPNPKGRPNQPRDPDAIFKRLDTDANGNLSREEFGKMFERRDRKGPGGSERPQPDAKTSEASKAEEAERKKVRGDEAANAADTTRSAGSTGGTGSSASGSAADGSAKTGTADPKP